MRIEAEQVFSLAFSGERAAALAFLRSPAQSLLRLRFLRDLQVTGGELRAVLSVQMPLLGTVTLPLHSRVVPSAEGARLESLPLTGERAWIELSGEGHTEEATEDAAGAGVTLHFAFRFVAHLDAPGSEGWGGAAFEKMVRAAAARTLTRLAQELPQGIAAALADRR